jgi:probable rRNA maturation factor
VTALNLWNRQRTRRLNLSLLRRVLKAFLEGAAGQWSQYDLAFYFVAAPEMTQVNETHLGHAGSTDVITFDYSDALQPGKLHGEIFVCVDEALLQARRFRTTWQSEVVRYAVHGILHLQGFDDRTARARAKMKAVENESVADLSRRFSFAAVGQPKRRKSGLISRQSV